MMRKKDNYFNIRKREDNLFEIEIKGERTNRLHKTEFEARADVINSMQQYTDKLLERMEEDSEPLTTKERKEIEIKQNKQLILNTIRKIDE